MIEAMPLLIPDTEFNLNKDEANRNYLIKLLDKKPKVISNFKGHDIYHYGSLYDGAYFVYDEDEKLIIYFMRYEGKKRHLAKDGPVVTQTSVWRGGTGNALSGITHYVVFGILLLAYPAIMSDREQTQSGKRLWVDLMTAALKLKYHVGIVDLTTMQTREATQNAELRLWAVGEFDSAWIETEDRKEVHKAKALRFFIARK